MILTLFCDGSVRALPDTIAGDALQALFTRNGREALSVGQDGTWRRD